MGRRGYSTTVGKFAKLHHARRVSEIRMLGELLRREGFTPAREESPTVHENRPDPVTR